MRLILPVLIEEESIADNDVALNENVLVISKQYIGNGMDHWIYQILDNPETMAKLIISGCLDLV